MGSTDWMTACFSSLHQWVYHISPLYHPCILMMHDSTMCSRSVRPAQARVRHQLIPRAKVLPIWSLSSCHLNGHHYQKGGLRAAISKIIWKSIQISIRTSSRDPLFRGTTLPSSTSQIISITPTLSHHIPTKANFYPPLLQSTITLSWHLKSIFPHSIMRHTLLGIISTIITSIQTRLLTRYWKPIMHAPHLYIIYELVLQYQYLACPITSLLTIFWVNNSGTHWSQK